MAGDFCMARSHPDMPPGVFEEQHRPEKPHPPLLLQRFLRDSTISAGELTGVTASGQRLRLRQVPHVFLTHSVPAGDDDDSSSCRENAQSVPSLTYSMESASESGDLVQDSQCYSTALSQRLARELGRAPDAPWPDLVQVGSGVLSDSLLSRVEVFIDGRWQSASVVAHPEKLGLPSGRGQEGVRHWVGDDIDPSLLTAEQRLEKMIWRLWQTWKCCGPSAFRKCAGAGSPEHHSKAAGSKHQPSARGQKRWRTGPGQADGDDDGPEDPDGNDGGAGSGGDGGDGGRDGDKPKRHRKKKEKPTGPQWACPLCQSDARVRYTHGNPKWSNIENVKRHLRDKHYGGPKSQHSTWLKIKAVWESTKRAERGEELWEKVARLALPSAVVLPSSHVYPPDDPLLEAPGLEDTRSDTQYQSFKQQWQDEYWRKFETFAPVNKLLIKQDEVAREHSKRMRRAQQRYDQRRAEEEEELQRQLQALDAKLDTEKASTLERNKLALRQLEREFDDEEDQLDRELHQQRAALQDVFEQEIKDMEHARARRESAGSQTQPTSACSNALSPSPPPAASSRDPSASAVTLPIFSAPEPADYPFPLPPTAACAPSARHTTMPITPEPIDLIDPHLHSADSAFSNSAASLSGDLDLSGDQCLAEDCYAWVTKPHHYCPVHLPGLQP